jgi:hypothetical protein
MSAAVATAISQIAILADVISYESNSSHSLNSAQVGNCKLYLEQIGSYLIETHGPSIDDALIRRISLPLHRYKVWSIRAGSPAKKTFTEVSALAAELCEMVESNKGRPRPQEYFEKITKLGELLESLARQAWS